MVSPAILPEYALRISQVVQLQTFDGKTSNNQQSLTELNEMYFNYLLTNNSIGKKLEASNICIPKFTIVYHS